MFRDLKKRLSKLETNLPPRETSEEEKSICAIRFLLVNAVGYYFGDPKPGEAPSEALARGMGYEYAGELLAVMKHKASGGKDAKFDAKYARAIRKLFAKFGINPKTADGRKFSEALERIHAGLSESYKERLARSY